MRKLQKILSESATMNLINLLFSFLDYGLFNRELTMIVIINRTTNFKINDMKDSIKLLGLLFLFLLIENKNVSGCTGIRLITKDSGVVYARSMEWGAFDLHSRVALIPRGYEFIGLTLERRN